MFKNKISVLTVASVALSVLSCLAGGHNAFAITKTWSGGNGDWSVASNWSPVGVPTIDDDVVINGGTPYLSRDIEANSLSSEYDCTVQDLKCSITDKSNNGVRIKVRNGIKKVSFDMGASKKSKLIIEGSNFTLDKSHLYGGLEIDLNGKTLNVTGYSSFLPDDESKAVGQKVMPRITGNGTVNYTDNTDGTASPVRENYSTDSTYTGVTNVNGAWIKAGSLNSFGKSEINVLNKGYIEFDFDEYVLPSDIDGKTMSNAINIFKPSNVSIAFATDGNNGKPITIKVPNITLQANTKIGGRGVIIDLAGIKSNGHCVVLYDPLSGIIDNGDSKLINEPTECSPDGFADDDSSNNTGNTEGLGDVKQSDKSQPGAPNAGFANLKSPLIIMAAGLGAAAFVLALTHRRGANR